MSEEPWKLETQANGWTTVYDSYGQKVGGDMRYATALDLTKAVNEEIAQLRADLAESRQKLVEGQTALSVEIQRKNGWKAKAAELEQFLTQAQAELERLRAEKVEMQAAGSALFDSHEDLRAQRDQAVLLARELGEVLKGSKSAMNNLAEMWSAEERGHDITSDKYDKKIQEWESKRTAALAKLQSLNLPPSDDTLKV